MPLGCSRVKRPHCSCSSSRGNRRKRSSRGVWVVAFVDVADEAHRDADRADVGDHPLRPGAWDIKTFSVGDASSAAHRRNAFA